MLGSIFLNDFICIEWKRTYVHWPDPPQTHPYVLFCQSSLVALNLNITLSNICKKCIENKILKCWHTREVQPFDDLPVDSSVDRELAGQRVDVYEAEDLPGAVRLVGDGPVTVLVPGEDCKDVGTHLAVLRHTAPEYKTEYYLDQGPYI